MSPHRKSTCIYRRILRLVPRIFKTDPWQTMFCFAWMGMGLATAITMLFPSFTSVVDQPLGWTILRALWSACFFFGGAFQLWALQWPKDGLLERLGISLAGMGCAVYSLALIAAWRPSGLVLAFVFGLIAIGHLIVLIASEVARRFTLRAKENKP